jgi:hypothetical protein
VLASKYSTVYHADSQAGKIKGSISSSNKKILK